MGQIIAIVFNAGLVVGLVIGQVLGIVYGPIIYEILFALLSLDYWWFYISFTLYLIWKMILIIAFYFAP